MRLPAVAIAVAFAAGIAPGLGPPLLALHHPSIFSELALTLAALLIAMPPMLAYDFHRVTLSGPFVPQFGLLLVSLRWRATVLLHATAWIAHFPR